MEEKNISLSCPSLFLGRTRPSFLNAPFLNTQSRTLVLSEASVESLASQPVNTDLVAELHSALQAPSELSSSS